MRILFRIYVSCLLVAIILSSGFVAFSPEIRAEDVTLESVRMQAEQGDLDAQLRLGLFYTLGSSVPPDYGEALKWYTMAAEQGDSGAQFEVGIMYRLGAPGYPKNYSEAAKWFRKAAEQGKTGAQYNLGNFYRFGQGVPQDCVHSYAWLSVAASQRYRKAIASLDSLTAEMTPQQIEKGRDLSARLLEKINRPK
jgi:TPR repeat protein